VIVGVCVGAEVEVRVSVALGGAVRVGLAIPVCAKVGDVVAEPSVVDVLVGVLVEVNEGRAVALGSSVETGMTLGAAVGWKI
jgi:hypothetical protein